MTSLRLHAASAAHAARPTRPAMHPAPAVIQLANLISPAPP
eukprot:CAMPEP_0170173692 /NCGR_PEP_ID=MMETSP0040_2-20121228/6974_1 /TAXON_ID=641309 /ORGANISM="Lotharella oceanica, Strain CCMP622" /LENGTH=40 /DNA_ID= /DNA_START= /DNA_END= /DNA_ORIENTATION=